MKNIKHVSCTAFLLMGLLTGIAHADTALHNIRGYTSTNDGIESFGVLIFDDDGRIIATGNDDLIADYPAATRLDGDGKTVLPGLTDAHAHVLGLGLLKTSLDLQGIPSVEDAVERIRDYVDANPSARWVLGRGWNQVVWPIQEFPTAAQIDAVVSDRPVWLRRVDGHAGWANSAALKIAGIKNDTPDPVGGKIIRDANGNATGVLIDRAMALVGENVPKIDKDETQTAISAAVRALLAEGVTGVHDAGISLTNAEVYLSMADDSQLDLRIYAMISGAGDALDAIGKPIRRYGNDRLEIAAVKLVSDGALGSRGAAMIEPYSDDVENRGLPFWTQEELDEQVIKANRMGFQVGIHAIGDFGNQLALNSFEKAQDGKPSPLRNRVEHAQIVAMADIPRFAELGVVASIQSTHATSDKNMAEERVGPERIRGGYAWRRLLDSGAILANGSDFPVELSNPFHGLYAAVTRQGRDGEPDGGWYADQALTRAEALHSYTLAAAYAANQEAILGSLEPGKWADFIVIDRDYFEVPSSEIDDIQVLQTWIGGEVVYETGGIQ
jgi:predicted amidohydrolase YtcJ